MVYFDVPLLLKQQFFESTTWLKSLSVLLQNYEQNTSVLVGYTTDRLSRILPNADNDFPMPSLLFQVARIPLPKGKWGIRLPHRSYYRHTGKPDAEGFCISNNTGSVRMPAYIQKGNGRLHLHGETCHSFALFPYLHPGIKVKPGNVTEKCHTGI